MDPHSVPRNRLFDRKESQFIKKAGMAPIGAAGFFDFV
jgi:hypothetical protein